jgi:hypothetical protein
MSASRTREGRLGAGALGVRGLGVRALTPGALAALALAFGPPANAGAGAVARARQAGAPVVQSMVVGSGGVVLSPARSVAASATSVRAGRRRCAVAAGTPLAVLAALRRAGGPAFFVRDYGRCGRSPAGSGQLFVYALGGEANRGQSGWEYKVAGVAGSTGAADPSGPRGDGRRLRSGEQVLWFWCAAHAGGCQRTLALSPASSSVGPGGSLAVTVRGLDNEGRAVPVAGAIVKLGSDFASTDAGGRATLAAPVTPGRYQLTAARAGLVPSFPGTIVVR